jgi:tRNA-2-methylthio-N6-dimethylallyladenosine synthase
MTTNNISDKTLFIRNFGCQMNDYDSLRIQKLLENYGFKKAEKYEKASHILLITCSVRQKAEDKVFSELGRINQIKKKNPSIILGVGGCLAQHHGKKLIKQFPFIDIVFGTQKINELPEIINAAEKGNKIVNIEMNNISEIYPAGPYKPEPGRICSFVSIMHGCNNYCTYCIVPYVRGPEKSRDSAEILNEITGLVNSGVKEITLLGQNVNSYNNEQNNFNSFPDLLKRINEIRGLERIRFVTSHPKDLSDKLILSFKQLDKLCEHIHLPLQSGSDTILKKMNRVYTSQEYIDKVSALRETVPGISITSDIIVGFPEETDDDFNNTVNIIKQIAYDDLFIFHYTDRNGTKASTLKDKIPYKVKIERLTILNELQRKISMDKNSKLINNKVSVLFENTSKYDNNFIAGRTRTNKVVNCKASADVIGSIRDVKINKANIHSLNGTLI